MSTEDNRTLFCAETDHLKWRLSAGGVSDVLNLALSPHTTDGSTYVFTSEGYDVRGLPDITIQAIIADNEDESSYHMHLEGSLDGVNYVPLPDSEFVPDLSTLALSTLASMVSIGLKLNYIRMKIYTSSGPPYQPTVFQASIIAGEA